MVVDYDDMINSRMGKYIEFKQQIPYYNQEQNTTSTNGVQDG